MIDVAKQVSQQKGPILFGPFLLLYGFFGAGAGGFGGGGFGDGAGGFGGGAGFGGGGFGASLRGAWIAFLPTIRHVDFASTRRYYFLRFDLLLEEDFFFEARDPLRFFILAVFFFPAFLAPRELFRNAFPFGLSPSPPVAPSPSIQPFDIVLLLSCFSDEQRLDAALFHPGQ